MYRCVIKSSAWVTACDVSLCNCESITWAICLMKRCFHRICVTHRIDPGRVGVCLVWPEPCVVVDTYPILLMSISWDSARPMVAAEPGSSTPTVEHVAMVTTSIHNLQ